MQTPQTTITADISDLCPCLCGPGFNPNWNEEFTFDIEIPALALVRFVVEDFDMSTKNDFIGQYTLPFTSLKQGKALLPAPHSPLRSSSVLDEWSRSIRAGVRVDFLGTCCHQRPWARCVTHAQSCAFGHACSAPCGKWGQNALRQGDVCAGSWQTSTNTFPGGLKAIFHLCLCFQVIATSIS